MENIDNIKKLKFPIGKFKKPDFVSTQQVYEWIKDIEEFPSQVKAITKGLSAEELQWRYRPNGWSIQQVVHHCADSHMNSFIRFKLSLTEDTPTIRPYFEDKWAEMPDVLDVPVAQSIQLLEGLHFRWVILLKSLDEIDLAKEFIHPEHDQRISIIDNIGIYSWHCRHHLAHIKQALQYRGVFN